MPVLINKESGLAENLSPEQMQGAISTGSHHVALNDPEGNAITAAYADAPSLMKQGYSQPSTEQLQGMLKYAKYSTPEEQAKAFAEGIGEGALGPLATLGEKALGVKSEDIRNRAEVHSGTKTAGTLTGFIGSAITGEGLAPVLGAIGKSASSLLPKATGAIAKLAVQEGASMATLQAGDEVSKMITEDPNQSFQTAITHVGLAAAMGGAGGAALGAISPLWKSTIGSKASQLIEDFKGRLGYHMNNPDPVGAVTEELQSHYSNVKNAAENVYGTQGLKSQDIAKMVPREITPEIGVQGDDVLKATDKMMAKAQAEPGIYQGSRLQAVNDYKNRLSSVLDNVNSTPAERFEALNEFKKGIGSLKGWNPLQPIAEKPGAKLIGDLYNSVKEGLENPEVWGKAAERQQAINKGFSEFLPTLKDFEKKFTTEMAGERVIDPGKVSTYMNQLGKPNAEIKQTMLDNFLRASEKYQKVITDTHANLGLDAPQINSSLSAAKASLDQLSPGAKLADVFVKKSLSKLAGSGLGATVGGAIGHTIGLGGIGALVGEHALGPFFSTILPVLVKPLMGGAADAEGLKGAVDYLTAVAKGSSLVEKAAKNVFKPSGEVISSSFIPNERDITRLDNILKQNQVDPSQMLNNQSKVGSYLPNHATAQGQLSANATNYLNSLRPNTDKQAPLDQKPTSNAIQKSQYRNALIIAQQPLSILSKIKSGEITPNDLKTFTTIYPDLHNKLASKLTEQMIEAKSKGTTIPYKAQMGLSMFLGTSLASSMSPKNILINQAVGMPSQQQQQPQGHLKSSMRDLSKGPARDLTPIQSREQDRTKA